MRYLNVIEECQNNIEEILGVESKKRKIEEISNPNEDQFYLRVNGKSSPYKKEKVKAYICGWRGQWLDRLVGGIEELIFPGTESNDKYRFMNEENATSFLEEKIRKKHSEIEEEIEEKGEESNLQDKILYDCNLFFCGTWGDISLVEEYFLRLEE